MNSKRCGSYGIHEGDLLGYEYGPDWLGGSPAEATPSQYENDKAEAEDDSEKEE